MSELEEYLKQRDIKNILITIILSSFGFLVALTWRDAIKQTIDLYLPHGQGLAYTYFAAFAVTIIALVVATILMKVREIELTSALQKLKDVKLNSAKRQTLSREKESTETSI